MTFGERLQTLILSEQISRQRLSEYLHISPSTLSCYIRGKRQPEYNMLLWMAAYFDTSTDYLLGRSGLRRSEESKLSENELDLIGLYRQMSSPKQELLMEEALLFLRIGDDLS